MSGPISLHSRGGQGRPVDFVHILLGYTDIFRINWELFITKNLTSVNANFPTLQINADSRTSHTEQMLTL